MNEAVSEVLAEEQVVLLDERFRPVGAAPKGSVHNSSTELHLAFSCYVFDSAGRVLVTRRALTKKTWPGVWTNSFCGHPGPDEPPERAVVRRARQELGMAVRDLRLALTDFRYRATDASGVVENEFCPVWIAEVDSSLRPDPAEVCEWSWVDWSDLVWMIDRAPFLFSPWSRLQVPRLADGRPPSTASPK